MHPADINAAIRKAGSSQAKVSRWFAEQGLKPVTHAAVHMVVTGRGSSARIARRISELTQIPVCVLWPDKYPALVAEQQRRQARRGAKSASARTGAAADAGALQP
jgi:lambda repressor-like predicted transcriptional regulator